MRDDFPSSSMSYDRMAKYYDVINSKRVNYEAQADYIEKILAKYGNVKSILDVACGTGNFTFIFAKRGYAVTGLDNSPEMLKVARKNVGSRSNPRFVGMDMRQIKLPEKFDAATVLFGGFGYLLARADVERFLRSSKQHLNRGGLLVFEFLQSAAIDQTATRSSGRPSWDVVDFDEGKRIVRLNVSRYDPRTKTHSVTFDHYVLDMKKSRVLDSFQERLEVMTHSISHVRALLKRNGYEPIEFYDGDIGNSKSKLTPASPSTFRVLAVAVAQ